MKQITFTFLLVMIFLAITATASSAVRAFATFDSKKDRRLEVRVPGGRVFITGVDGDSVIVNAYRTYAEGEEPEPYHDRHDDPRATGLRRLTDTETGLEIWAEDNSVFVGTSMYAMGADVHVQVPRNAVITVSGQFADSVLVRNMNERVSVRTDGSVRLESIRGDVEVKTGSGWIFLEDVTGGVVANSQFGGIEGSLNPRDPDKPISLIATGHIDVSMPANVKATLTMKTSFGELFTDFDMTLQPKKGSRSEAPQVYSISRSKKGGYGYYYYRESSDKEDDDDVDDNNESARDKKEPKEPEKPKRIDPEPVIAPDPPASVYVHGESGAVVVVPPVGRAPIVPYGSARVASLNGGGVEISITTMSGNIYIRKLK